MTTTVLFVCRHLDSGSRTRRLLLLFFLLGIGQFLVSCGIGDRVAGPDGRDPQANGLHVPDGFVIERAVPPEMVSYPMFATLDNRGRLFIIESSGKTTSTEDVLKNPTFKILLLEDTDEDGIYDKRNVYADKIPYPMGGTFYQGSFYVAAPPELLRFTDTDGDGVSEKREVILSGWVLSHNAATLSGPFFGPDGWLYMCDARRGFEITTKEGVQLEGKSARIWRCRPDGTDLEAMSGGGFDNTIELIFMPAGETVGTMTYFTDPKDGFRDALMHWVEGGVYPKYHPVIETDELTLTGALMPVMTKLPRVSHAGLMRYRGSVFGNEFEGNLFSAQFNTGRVMRHVVTSVGATFRTEEEPFMTSDSLDSHPTDVLEDADGSLLVVNTGGWFIAGCPLSVVAKTDVHGGIFRIRKVDAPTIEDPWGRRLNFTAMSVDSIVLLLSDARPAVRDNAIEKMILRGEDAIEPLKEALNSSENEEVRTAVVFALHRINLPLAIDAVRTSLADKSAMVRTAAARVLGLAKDGKSVDKLAEMVKNDKPPVRRQAATALGQIGDDGAIGPLLAASANPDDRFVEHAIIYSLITLGETAPMVRALSHPLENVRKSALIVLDQIEGSPLRKNHIVPFLQSKNESLQNTGIWVVTHHPEWSDIVITFLKSQLKKGELSAKEKVLVSDLMTTFSEDQNLQSFVSSRILNSATPVARKILLLDVISRYHGRQLPVEWIRLLGNLLQQENAFMRSEVLDLVASRGVPELDKNLIQIIERAETPIALKIKALNARITSDRNLSDVQFNMLLNFLLPTNESPVKQSAVRLLGQADLTEAQLLRLAKEQVPSADIFLLPALVNAFQGSHSEEVGETLIAALQTSTDRLDNLSLLDLQQVLESFPASVTKSAEPIMKTLQERQGKRLSQLDELEASLNKGDVGEGRKLFFGKALCSSCHAIIGQGEDFGPDLTNIGEIRSQHDILEAILFPSASFAREYETSKVVTKTKYYTGIIKQQLPETIIIETGPGTSVRISTAEITGIEPQSVSLMPPGLDKQLTREEMADLMAYLRSLPDGLGHLRKQELGSN